VTFRVMEVRGSWLLRKRVDGSAWMDQRGWMSVINWGEIFYNTDREQRPDPAERVLLRLDTHPMEIVGADKNFTRDAVLLKGKHRIAYRP
jgi:hypothetical protein